MNPAHLDHEALADLAEGLLDDDHAASANAHLDDCAECRERSADLADVSRILAEIADIPVPPMPAELAARIDDAIRAESMATATVGSLEHRRGRRHLRIFSAAAAAVVAIGGGAVVGNSLLNDSSRDSSPSSLAPPADNPGSQGGAAESAPKIQSGPGAGAQSSAPAAPGPYRVISSGTDYRADALLRLAADRSRAGQALGRLEDSSDSQVRGCVSRLGGGQTPTFVDVAKYEGSPATVIVFGEKPGSVRVFVAGPKCSAQTDDLITQKTG